jgi:large repetitive protein
LMADGGNSLEPVVTPPLSSVQHEVLPAEVLAGKRLFFHAEDPRISADGYLACASCHLDGGNDGRVWDFTQRGEGLRRSTTLKGRAGTGHGPLHWTANFDEVQDFEHDIREAFGGTGLMNNALFFAGSRDQPLGDPKAGHSGELDALSAYLESLDRFDRSPWRAPDGSLGASALAGRTLFVDLGCARCHGGADFTDSAALRWHDVGTVDADGMRMGEPLQGIDTPTLRGLWREPRFLHDGRAADLAAVFVVHDPAGVHGAVASLGSTQRAALIDYLLAIDDLEPAAPAPFALSITAPADGLRPDPGRPVTLAIATDLDGLQRVDYLLDGAVVASATSAPWQAAVELPPGARHRLQARLIHASGATTSSWPQSVWMHEREGRVFAHGFEGD